MLIIATAVAALFTAAHAKMPIAPAAGCPSAPELAYRTSALRCPALDVSGRVDATPALDPVFDVETSPNTFVRLGRGLAALVGTASDGRVLFEVPLEATNAFHVTVPLAPQAEAALARLRLVTPFGTVERIATVHAEPVAEAIATSDIAGVFAWNARAFPGVRIAAVRGGPYVAVGGGDGTYEQLNVPTASNVLVVEFSDGLHSTTRTVRFFGR